MINDEVLSKTNRQSKSNNEQQLIIKWSFIAPLCVRDTGWLLTRDEKQRYRAPKSFDSTFKKNHVPPHTSTGKKKRVLAVTQKLFWFISNVLERE